MKIEETTGNLIREVKEIFLKHGREPFLYIGVDSEKELEEKYREELYKFSKHLIKEYQDLESKFTDLIGKETFQKQFVDRFFEKVKEKKQEEKRVSFKLARKIKQKNLPITSNCWYIEDRGEVLESNIRISNDLILYLTEDYFIIPTYKDLMTFLKKKVEIEETPPFNSLTGSVKEYQFRIIIKENGRCFSGTSHTSIMEDEELLETIIDLLPEE